MMMMDCDSSNNKKNCRFNRDVEVFLIPSRGDITMEEVLASNYSEEEFGHIRQRERKLTRQLSRLGAVIDVGEDELGLESSQAKSRRKARQQEGQMSVLLEQTLQNDVEHHDPDYLANIYAHYTKESATLAYRRGLRVAEHVKIMSFCDSSSRISKQQRQHMIRSSRWRSPTTDRAPLAPMAHIMGSHQINAGQQQQHHHHHNQKQSELTRTPHPWEQWAKHMTCSTSNEGIQIRV